MFGGQKPSGVVSDNLLQVPDHKKTTEKPLQVPEHIKQLFAPKLRFDGYDYSHKCILWNKTKGKWYQTLRCKHFRPSSEAKIGNGLCLDYKLGEDEEEKDYILKKSDDPSGCCGAQLFVTLIDESTKSMETTTNVGSLIMICMLIKLFHLQLILQL